MDKKVKQILDGLTRKLLKYYYLISITSESLLLFI